MSVPVIQTGSVIVMLILCVYGTLYNFLNLSPALYQLVPSLMGRVICRRPAFLQADFSERQRGVFVRNGVMYLFFAAVYVVTVIFGLGGLR